jgi:hypothetical protein
MKGTYQISRQTGHPCARWDLPDNISVKQCTHLYIKILRSSIPENSGCLARILILPLLPD